MEDNSWKERDRALILQGESQGGGWWKQQTVEAGGDLWGSTCPCLHFLSSPSICFCPLTETGHREEGDEEQN